MNEKQILRQLTALCKYFPDMDWKVHQIVRNFRGEEGRCTATFRSKREGDIRLRVLIDANQKVSATAMHYDENDAIDIGWFPRMEASNALDAVHKLSNALLRCADALVYVVEHDSKEIVSSHEKGVDIN